MATNARNILFCKTLRVIRPRQTTPPKRYIIHLSLDIARKTRAADMESSRSSRRSSLHFRQANDSRCQTNFLACDLGNGRGQMVECPHAKWVDFLSLFAVYHFGNTKSCLFHKFGETFSAMTANSVIRCPIRHFDKSSFLSKCQRRSQSM